MKSVILSLGLDLYYPECTTFSPLKSLYSAHLICLAANPSNSPSKTIHWPAYYDSPLTTVFVQNSLSTESKYMAGTVDGWHQLHKASRASITPIQRSNIPAPSNDQIHTLFPTTNGFQICLPQSENLELHRIYKNW